MPSRKISSRHWTNVEVLLDRIANPKPVLEAIGFQLKASSQKAFLDQALGDIAWEERYPDQAEPFINIAGALSDLRKGTNIRKRRFDRRPALIDNGLLRNSQVVSFGSGPRAIYRQNMVTVSSKKKYAAAHQWGGVSTQNVTKTALNNLRIWLEKQGKQEGEEAKATWSKKLGFLKHISALSTTHVQRPFLGITDDDAKAITDLVVEFLTPEDEFLGPIT